MSAIKKVVVLSSKQSGRGPLAVLTIHRSGGGVFATIKNYDIHITDGILGISANGKQVVKQHISWEGQTHYNFKLDKNFNLNAKLGCVLMGKVGHSLEPIVWGFSGSEQGRTQVDALRALVDKMHEINQQGDKSGEVVLKKINDNSNAYNQPPHANPPKAEQGRGVSMPSPNNQQQGQDSPSPAGEKFSQATTESAIITTIAKCKARASWALDDDGCTPSHPPIGHAHLHRTGFNDVRYTQPLDDSSSMQQLEERVIKTNISKEEADLYQTTDEQLEEEVDEALGFYHLIKEQLDELFKKYPAEAQLEELIPDSKWVKVDYEDNGHHYVIGLIYYNHEIKYICYGVPGRYSQERPAEFAKYSQWLPTDVNNPHAEGYWVMYQDATSGDSVNLEVV